MHHPNRAFRVASLLIGDSLGLSACGGGSGNQATTLLKQTFGQPHTINSGNLNLSLVVVPSGSGTASRPVTLSFGGPFQSRGTGKLPASNFSISISSAGRSGSLGVLSTGT